jgi:hypothetical protein
MGTMGRMSRLLTIALLALCLMAASVGEGVAAAAGGPRVIVELVRRGMRSLRARPSGWGSARRSPRVAYLLEQSRRFGRASPDRLDTPRGFHGERDILAES